MPEGMLGNLTLSEIRGPLDTLQTRMAGKEGRKVLDSLNRMLRGENPFPIVSRVQEGLVIPCAHYGEHALTLYELFNRISPDAQDVLKSEAFGKESETEDVELVLLHFDWTKTCLGDLEYVHILTEMNRLGFERPTLMDAVVLAGAACRRQVQGRQHLVFMHKPVSANQYTVAAGALVTNGRFDAALMLRGDDRPGCQTLETKDVRYLSAKDVYVARKRVRQ